MLSAVDHLEVEADQHGGHAESKVTNVFKDMGTGKENELIDDSKPRKTKTE